ncbi:hypothetical protein AB9M62_25295 [Bacillales bacterium AN1005]
MLEFLKEYGVIVTIIGIITSSTIAIVLYFKNKKRKILAYELAFTRPVVENLTDDIRIHYKDGTEITDTLSLVVLKFINVGNEPIKRDDFDEKGVFLNFSKSNTTSTIYDINVGTTKPANLKPEVFNDNFGEKVGFKPLLLNPKDEFYLDILMTKFDDLIVDARIVGGTLEIYKNKQKKLARYKVLYQFVYTLIVVAFTFLFTLIGIVSRL